MTDDLLFRAYRAIADSENLRRELRSKREAVESEATRVRQSLALFHAMREETPNGCATVVPESPAMRHPVSDERGT